MWEGMADRRISHANYKPTSHSCSQPCLELPSLRNSLIVLLTVVSPNSVCRWIVPFEHQMPDPSTLALSARNIMICFLTGLPKRRPAQRFATFRLMLHLPAGLRSACLWHNIRKEDHQMCRRTECQLLRRFSFAHRWPGIAGPLCHNLLIYIMPHYKNAGHLFVDFV